MEYSSAGSHELKRVRKAPLRGVNGLLLSLIVFYQRCISPRKGWRCAYSVLNGGPGCSGFARETIETHGWQKAIPLVRQRFRDCHSAAQTVRALQQDSPFSPPEGDSSPPPDSNKKNRSPKNGSSSDNCDCIPDIPCCTATELMGDCHPHLFSACDASHCHIGACDAGACDLGGCDACACGW
jgi:putative component of membrane protein insertase Oxa1/YidC/SpoIIIJ protein YidD